MIAFGCAIGSEEKYRRFALPGSSECETLRRL
jgi:hypothetical protein